MDTRERILDVAQDLFARAGYDNTGLAQIAQEVGITKPAIYYHFHSKEELFAGLLARFATNVQLMLAPVLASGSPEEQLNWLIRGYIGIVWERYDLAQVISSEFFGKGTAVLGPLATRVQELVLQPIERILELGIEAAAFRPVDPHLTALSVFGAIHAYLGEYRLRGRTTPPEVFADHTVALILEGLRRA